MTGLWIWAPLALAAPGRDAPGTVRPTRHWDFQHMDLALELDPEAGTVSGTVHHRVSPLGRPDRWLTLNQHGLVIDEVQVDGEAVSDWRITEETLEIPVPSGQATTHDVMVSWTASPERGLHFRQPAAKRGTIAHVWSQGEGIDHRHWFPTWDYPSDRLTWTVSTTAPNGWSVFGNGELEGPTATEDGQQRWVWTLEEPTAAYLLALGAGPLDRHVHQGSRVPLEVWTLEGTHPSAAEHLLEVTADQLPFFEALLGTPYPYPAYRQLIVQHFLYSGMENASATILGDHLLPDTIGGPAQRLDSVGAHELAHQWFGDLLTCYGWRELWLNEGFATYYGHRWNEHHRSRAELAPGVLDRRDGAAQTKGPMAARAWSKRGNNDNANVYGRGASVLRYLEFLLGREVFDAGIAAYVAQNQGRFVESEDLRRALEDVSGQELGWVFDQWVTGAGAPALQTRWRFGDDAITIDVERIDDGPAFYGAVEVEVGTTSAVQRLRLWLDGDGGRLVLPANEPPSWVAVDPDAAFIARWEAKQSPAAWRAQARHSPTPEARALALRKLGEAPPSDDVDALLAELLRDDGLAIALRAEAAKSLGRRATPASDEALLGVLDGAAAELAEATLTALGTVPPLDDARRASRTRAVREALSDDRATVAVAALQSLAELDESAALGQARRWLTLRDDTPTRRRHTTAATVLGRSTQSADLALLTSRAAPRYRRWPRQAAARAAVQVAAALGAQLASGDRRRLQHALMAIAQDEDLRLRSLGITLLGEIGDEAALPGLQELAATTQLVELAQAAHDAAARIRQRGEKPAATEESAATDLQRLTERLDRLQSQLDELAARP